MLLETVYIQRERKLLEGRRMRQKVMEGNGTTWNLMEVSRKHENIP